MPCLGGPYMDPKQGLGMARFWKLRLLCARPGVGGIYRLRLMGKRFGA